MGALEIFRQAGIDVRPGSCITLYGAPGLGKTCLALALAKALGRPTVLIATEPNMADGEFIKFAMRYAPGDVDFQDLTDRPTTGKVWYRIQKAMERGGPVTLIVDSLSALVDAIAVAEGQTDPRVLAARTSTAVRTIAYLARQCANRTGGTSILIAQASSTAGAQPYRGRFAERPAFTRRVDHYVSHEALLAMDVDAGQRVLTCTLNRSNPWLEGRSARFRFTESDVELVEEGRRG